MQPIDILPVDNYDGDRLLTREALQELKSVNKILVVIVGFEALNNILPSSINELGISIKQVFNSRVIS